MYRSIYTLDAPSAPTGLCMTSCTQNTVGVTWTSPSSDGGAPITGYGVYQRRVDEPDDAFKLVKVGQTHD